MADESAAQEVVGGQAKGSPLPKPRNHASSRSIQRWEGKHRLSIDVKNGRVVGLVVMGYTFSSAPDANRGMTGFVPLQDNLMSILPQKLSEKPESLLVTEAKSGSYEAFEELVSRYEKKIYRLALRLTGNNEDAEDVLQESFLKAYEHLPDFRQDSRFYTWLVRITVNEGLMRLRKLRSDKSEPLEDKVSDDGQITPREFRDWKPNPEETMQQKEMEDLLLKAAQSLPSSLRTVFLLRDMEELSTEETANLLSLTTGAVKARLFRARMQLREELSQALKQE
ncbi:MAG TPA: sigma-70 family RNA polymerase sigma factor [Terriglobia bacterium]|nr:sigma-70 family RNA polymerase sigma factor [Terriglobia bacterium]